MLRNVGKGVFTDGVDDRDHGEPHGKADDQGVARIISHASGVVEPLRKVTGKQRCFNRPVQAHTGIHCEQQHRAEKGQFRPRLETTASRKRHQPPQKRGRQGDERKSNEHQEYCRNDLCHPRRQPQPSKEAQNHTGEGGHHLDRRFDKTPQARVHELRGIDRPANASGNGEQQGIKRAFEGAVGERGQAKLGLKFITPAAGLPGIVWMVIALIPHLAEQGFQTNLRVRVMDVPMKQLSLRVYC